jgi:hypothetical protein
VQQLETENFGFVRASVVDGQDHDAILGRKNLLKRMVADPNCRLALEDPVKDPAAKYLLEHNILFYDGKYISPQNVQFQKAVDEYVRMFCN